MKNTENIEMEALENVNGGVALATGTGEALDFAWLKEDASGSEYAMGLRKRSHATHDAMLMSLD